MTAHQPINLGRRFTHRSSCRDKVWFRSYSKALRAAANLSKIEDEEPGEIRPYQCRFCGCWHVGHRP